MGNPVLVERTRGNLVESFHNGSICIVNQTGDTIFSLGDINQLSFTRSALKPFQSIALIETGAAKAFKLSDAEIAVTCGSHNAEIEHLQAVNSILNKIGLTKTSLKCGPQLPTGKIPRNELRKSGAKPEHIHNNCSGKHAGFLAICVHMNWPTENYLAENHPLQKLIKQICAQMFEVSINDFVLGEDGCSAPNYATSLYQQAVAYKNLVSGNHSEKRNNSCKKIVDACLSYPLMVAGSDRYCTDIIKAANGHILGKTGADGVFCMALPKLGYGIAIKIDDGKMGPQYFVAQAIIKALGIKLKNELHQYQESSVINWNKHNVGIQRCSLNLTNQLKTISSLKH
ncbi:MAG: asparaginase [Bacteroidia bacterium]